MGSMPVALSVHNFISSVGADAGFAAIIGLAVLILLYFAHARETANLRDEAEELSHRLLQAEARLAELTRQQSVGAPAPAPAPPAAAAASRAEGGSSIRVLRSTATAAAAPAAPAGVAAPALAAATRAVPIAALAADPGDGHGAQRDLAIKEPAAIEEPAQPVAAAPATELAAAGGRPMAASAPVAERAAHSAGPAPATAAGAANGGGGRSATAPPFPGRPASPPPRRPQSRSGTAATARRPSLPPRGGVRAERRGGRRFVLLVGGLLAVAVIAALVIITQSGGSTHTHAGASQTTNAPGPAHRTRAPFSPSSVTVAVLNGTATNELAHRVAAKLTGVGYKQGTVATASNQAQSATVVAYRPGFRNDALHVATALKLGPTAVQPIDAGTQAIACPPPSPCTANVVVTVGQDLATL